MLTSLITLAAVTLLPLGGRSFGPDDGWWGYRMSDACGIEAGLPTGTRVAVVIPAKAKSRVGVMLSNPAWSSLVEGEAHETQIKLGNAASQTVSGAVVRSPSGMLGIAFGFDRQTLMEAMTVSRNGVMRVSIDGREIAVANVRSMSAATALMRCSAGQTDPFAQ